MNDEQVLSEYLDGRLDADAAAALQRRLEREPELAAELDALRRLQAISEGLAFTPGVFSAEEVLVRAGTARPPAPWRWRTAAAAVLLLAVSHGAVYLLGAHRGPEDAPAAAPLSPLADAEDLLERAADLDLQATPDRLRAQLVSLQDDLREASPRLSRHSARADVERRRRTVELVEALGQLEAAFVQVEDPGFLGLVVAQIAEESLRGAPMLRFLPASAETYQRVQPLRGGRFRVYLVDATRGAPRVVVHEGTQEELAEKHIDLNVTTGD